MGMETEGRKSAAAIVEEVEEDEGLQDLSEIARTHEPGDGAVIETLSVAQALIRLVAVQGVQLLALGFFAGGIAAWGAMRFVQHQWPAIPPSDPLIWTGAVIVLSAGVAAVLLQYHLVRDHGLYHFKKVLAIESQIVVEAPNYKK